MTFTAPPLLRNSHIQSVLSSSILRRPRLKKQGRALARQSVETLLTLNNGERLHAIESRQAERSGVPGQVILLHGWEGCFESNYLWSAAITLFNAGYDVIRLHLHDHGPSYPLNCSLFHAARHDEIAEGCLKLFQRQPGVPASLFGFSLGGNFALRVAACEPTLKLSCVAAISPVINPAHTYEALDIAPRWYERYFVKRWQRSLAAKARHFPDLMDMQVVENLGTLREMTTHLVTGHTFFESLSDYFAAYTIDRQTLEKIPCAVRLISSRDDPIIPYQDFEVFETLSQVQLTLTDHGGHCAFLSNWRLEGWIDKQLLLLLAAEKGG